jgi:hypothetical protein
MLLASCSRPSQLPGASHNNSLMRIESLPPADPQKFQSLRNMKDWKNPYLIVRADGVALLKADANEQRLLDPDRLTDELGQLPASAWPYGRVVAVAESATTNSDDDKARLRRNRAVVAGTLESLQVQIDWVSSP